MATSKIIKNTGEPLEAIDAEIADAIVMATAVDDDDLSDAATAAAKSFRPVRALLVDVSKSFAMTTIRNSTAIDEGVKAARDAVPKFGGDVRTAQDAAEALFRKNVVRRTVAEVGQRFGDKAAKVAGACVDANRAFSDAVATETAVQLGWAAGPKKVSLEALLVEERDVCRLSNPMTTAQQVKAWRDALRSGDEDLIRRLTFALPRVFQKLFDVPKTTTYGRRAQQTPPSSAEAIQIGTEMMQARQVLREIEQKKIEMLPVGLTQAKQVLKILEGIFAAIFALDVARMEGSAFREYESKILSGEPVDAYAIAPDWLTRDLGPGPPPLPWMAGNT